MPKTPINSRQALIVPVLGPGSTPYFRHFDWNIVQTDLGPMVESRADGIGYDATEKIIQLDMVDAQFNEVIIIDEADFQRRFQHGGAVSLADFNA